MSPAAVSEIRRRIDPPTGPPPRHPHDNVVHAHQPGRSDQGGRSSSRRQRPRTNPTLLEVSWEWTGDANRQPVSPGHEDLAERITAWPLLCADRSVAILAIVQSGRVVEDASPRRSQQFGKRRVRAVDEVQWTS